MADATRRFLLVRTGITTTEAAASMIPGMLSSGTWALYRETTDSAVTYATSNITEEPTKRSDHHSPDSLLTLSPSRLRRHTRARPEVTSIALSNPKPVKAILPASTPRMTAITPSTQ